MSDQNLSVATNVESQRIRLILDVDFTLNGVSVMELQSNMERLVEHGIANGMLTQHSPAEVEQYKTEVTPMLSESRALIDDSPNEASNDYRLSPDQKSCWIGVGNISVHVIRYDDCVEVGLWANGAAGEEPMVMTQLSYSEVEEDLCRYYDGVKITDVSNWAASLGTDLAKEDHLSRADWIKKYSDHLLTRLNLPRLN